MFLSSQRNDYAIHEGVRMYDVSDEDGVVQPAQPDTVRAEELQQLRAVCAAPGGNGRFIAVVGEPGSGKTRLLSLLARERQWSEHPATVYQCARREQRSAIDAVRALQRQNRHGGGTARCGTVSRLRNPRACRELVILDDAHLADEHTIAALCDMASGATPPLADVVVALRPRQTPVELIDAIVSGVTFGGTVRLTLSPLSSKQTCALLGVHPPLEMRRRSGGNPFNLLALQALADSDRLGTDTAVAPFEFAIAHETRDLTIHERYVLYAAAVLRSQFDSDLLAEVADVNPLVVPATVASLVRRDLLRTDARGDMSIRDEVFGTLLHRRIDPCWLTAAHQRAIHRLTARGLSDTQIGFHLVNSLSRVRANELARIVAAAEEMATTDVGAAISWLTPVIAETSTSDPLGRRSRLLLSTALAQVGRMPEGRELLFLLYEDSPESRGQLTDQIAFMAVAEGVVSNDMEIVDLVDAQLADSALAGGRDWASLRLAHDFRRTMQAKVNDEIQLDRALAVAREHNDQMLVAGLLSIRALNGTASGETRRALADVELAGQLIDRSPEHQVARQPAAMVVMGLADIYTGRLVDARKQLSRSVTIANNRGLAFLLPTLLVLLSESERHLGLLAQARETADTALVESGPDNALRHAQAVALKSLADVWLQPVGSKRAKLLAQQALAQQAMSNINVNGSASIAALTLAKCAWLDGDANYCITLLLNEGKGGDLSSIPTAHRSPFWELLCAAALDARLPMQEWATRSQAHAEHIALSNVQGYADLTRGHAARADGDAAAAAEHYLSAAARFVAASMAIEQSYALGHAAGALLAQGRIEKAAEQAGLAREIARRSDAHTLLHWIDLRTTVDSGQNTEVADLLGDLTRREREIALLICSGIKRREIAERLIISPRTVDVHLTRIYRKTGVSSRGELTAVLAEQSPPGSRFKNHLSLLP